MFSSDKHWYTFRYALSLCTLLGVFLASSRTIAQEYNMNIDADITYELYDDVLQGAFYNALTQYWGPSGLGDVLMDQYGTTLVSTINNPTNTSRVTQEFFSFFRTNNAASSEDVRILQRDGMDSIRIVLTNMEYQNLQAIAQEENKNVPRMGLWEFGDYFNGVMKIDLSKFKKYGTAEYIDFGEIDFLTNPIIVKVANSTKIVLTFISGTMFVICAWKIIEWAFGGSSI